MLEFLLVRTMWALRLNNVAWDNVSCKNKDSLYCSANKEKKAHLNCSKNRNLKETEIDRHVTISGYTSYTIP